MNETPEPTSEQAEAPQRRWRGTIWRLVERGVAAVLVLVAALLVTVVTIDLGPAVRGVAEREGGKRLDRELTIGRLSIRLATGQVVVEDLRIGGLTPEDRPFLEADRIAVSLSWAPLLRREVFIEAVDMTGWRMVVETFPGGRHSFPRLTSTTPSREPRRFVTTVQRVRATDGEFVYDDHGTPWTTVARNLEVTVVKAPDYHGEASFSGGTVKIMGYEPMWANMRTRFTIDGPRLHLEPIELETDGAESLIVGDVDLSRWPEQTYEVRSRVHFPRMRELFFAKEDFSLYGDGEFMGTFHLFKGGRDLSGRFESEMAGVDDFRFPNLRGSLRWLPGTFRVTNAQSGFYGGRTNFDFSMEPIGAPTPAIGRLDATYEDVDLAQLTDFLETEGLRLAGRASGRHLLEWPLGRFRQLRGDGSARIDPPAGIGVQPPQLSGDETIALADVGPFSPHGVLGYLPIGGEVTYRYGPEWIDFAPSRIATPRTHVAFSGRTAYGERSTIDFRVWSADWQESDRVLVSVLTAFGAPTRAVPVGGSGEFEGTILGRIGRPRIDGRFAGERLRAWDVVWGSASADVVLENSYVTVENAVIVDGDSEIEVDGRFSLGYPRRDGGEEIDARVRISRRPIDDLKHAFELDDYRVSGLLSGEFHLFGRYTTPFGFGRIAVDEGIAYGEPFETATAGLRFEGDGVRVDAIEAQKGGGTITGAAFVSWNGTYTFNADGRRIAVESLAAAEYPQAQPTGLLDFSASGTGEFDDPRYSVRLQIVDLFVGDEGVGEVTTRLAVRDEVLTLELEAASARLAVSGSGRIALTPAADSELTFRFSDTSLDPYVRAFQPRLSPFTRAVASGTLRVAGELRNLDRLAVDASVEQLDLELFDYDVANDGPIDLSLSGGVVRIERLRLAGDGTALVVGGDVDLTNERLALSATGDANLGILQGFVRDIRSSGRAVVEAEITGAYDAPRFTGSATIADGRIRHFSLPHSLETINGRVAFGATGITIEDVTAQLGGGEVRLGGRIGLDGFTPDELNVTAVGEDMRLRYPEGFRSLVDANLALRGDVSSPLLTGTVGVRSAVWGERFGDADLVSLTASRDDAPPPPPTASSVPLRFDVQISAPGTLRIENNAARIVARADLTLRGTYDHPLLFGRADIERGEVLFEGNRYVVTAGSIDFANPTRIEPFFDIEAETRVRVPGETYRVMFRVTGSADRFVPDLSSDPPLPTVDILALLFGDARDPRNADIRALQDPDLTEQELLRARATRLLASPISSGVGRVVEETFGVDTVQITPSLGDPTSQQSSRLTPTARLTIGKRISDRVFLTFSRSLATSTRDQIIFLEYDQTDRIAWIISQNEDRTYALDFRVRHSF